MGKEEDLSKKDQKLGCAVLVTGSIVLLLFLLIFILPLVLRSLNDPSSHEISKRPKMYDTTTVISEQQIFGIRGKYGCDSYIFKNSDMPFIQELPEEVQVSWCTNNEVYKEDPPVRFCAITQSIPTQFAYCEKIGRDDKSITLYLDNATRDEVEILVDTTKVPVLPAMSNAKVLLPKGIHKIQVRKFLIQDSYDDKEVYLSDRDRGITNKDILCYFYNVDSVNTYHILTAEYAYKKKDDIFVTFKEPELMDEDAPMRGIGSGNFFALKRMGEGSLRDTDGSPFYTRMPDKIGLQLPDVGKYYAIKQGISTQYDRVYYFREKGRGVTIYFDNATHEEYELYNDSYGWLNLPARSHVEVVLSEGLNNIKIRKRWTSEYYETGDIYLRGVGPIFEEGISYYVYNVGGANEYRLISANYTIIY